MRGDTVVATRSVFAQFGTRKVLGHGLCSQLYKRALHRLIRQPFATASRRPTLGPLLCGASSPSTLAVVPSTPSAASSTLLLLRTSRGCCAHFDALARPPSSPHAQQRRCSTARPPRHDERQSAIAQPMRTARQQRRRSCITRMRQRRHPRPLRLPRPPRSAAAECVRPRCSNRTALSTQQLHSPHRRDSTRALCIPSPHLRSDLRAPVVRRAPRARCTAAARCRTRGASDPEVTSWRRKKQRQQRRIESHRRRSQRRMLDRRTPLPPPLPLARLPQQHPQPPAPPPTRPPPPASSLLPRSLQLVPCSIARLLRPLLS